MQIELEVRACNTLCRTPGDFEVIDAERIGIRWMILMRITDFCKVIVALPLCFLSVCVCFIVGREKWLYIWLAKARRQTPEKWDALPLRR